MDEAEKYQQRLQAIAEKRRQQEEEERTRRETEEELLKLAQRQRKSLRDQWLMEPAPSPAPPSLSADNPGTDDHTEDQAEIHLSTEQEEELEARQEEDASANTHHNHSQANAEEEVMQQGYNRNQGQLPQQMMSRRVLHENGHGGRSVLGMVSVQVERDPRTGATTIRSVVPVSADCMPEAASVPLGATVFDDGRKRVLAVGGGQPSAEELGHILSAIDEVGMKMVLEEVTATPRGKQMQDRRMEREERQMEDSEMEREDRQTEDKGMEREDRQTEDKGMEREDRQMEDSGMEREEREGRRDVTSGPTQDGLWQEEVTESSYEGAGGELEIEGCHESGGEEEEEYGGREEMGGGGERRTEEEGPVTLTFLGYAEAETAGQNLGYADHGGLLRVERVVITDQGEEEELEPHPPQGEPINETRRHENPADSTSRGAVREGEVGGGGGGEGQEERGQTGEEAQGGGRFQDVPLDGAGAELHPLVTHAQAPPPAQAPPSRAEGNETPPKRKTCQCCSVM